MATQVSLNSGAVASAGALALQTNGTTEAVSISTGQVATFAQNPILTSGTANGVAYLNGSKVLTTGSALVFDGSNLGLGVTPSAWGSSFKALQMSYATMMNSSAGGYYGANFYYNSSGNPTYVNNGYALAYSAYSAGGAHLWLTAPSGTAGNAITFTQAMTLDASGNLVIGDTSTGFRFDSVVSSTGDVSIISARTTGAGGQGLKLGVNTTNSVTTIKNNSSSTYGMAFYSGSGSSEAMRIDSSGNLLVGDTSAYSGSRLSVKTGNNNGTTHAWYAKNSSATVLGYQRDDGLFNTGAATNSPYNFTTASAANLFVDSSGTFYRSTSSLKYKTDVQDATHGLAEVLSLRPVTYRGKNDGETIFGGLIAEEVDAAGLTEFVQYAEDGTPDALAYGNMVSLCIKAIQELNAKFEEYKATHP